MYSILFHICGVILLEAGFFFYYIGPIETEMFKTKLLKLTREPIEYINNKNEMMTPMEKEVLKNMLFYENKDNTIEENYNEIYQKSKLSEEYRYNQNMLLLREMIEYWCVLFTISILTYLIYYYYEKVYKKKHKIIEYYSPRKLQLNEIENGTYYRKDSIDDEDVGLIENNNNNNIIIIFCTKKAKMISYLLFAFLLILFQYLFFQYIVFQYNPLTIDEVKYILYSELIPVLDEYRNNTDSTYIPIPFSTLPPFMDI
tara:strand:- start:30 stop:800 length:771 start_codon:yes stop_codon:yes gene_type:complete